MAKTRVNGDRYDFLMELLERSEDLGVLHRNFEHACHGHGSTVIVCGSAGLGKTSLVQTFLEQITSQGEATVMHGGCDDLIAPRSFGPFRDMARSSGVLSSELVHSPNREDLLDSLSTLLDRPSRPAVVVIEDAHWADDASIDVMRYLARRIVSMHALMIVTMRDRELDRAHPARGLLTGPTSTAPTEVRLQPLSLKAVTKLATDSPLQAGYLHDVSGGNPFLIKQLLAGSPEDAARSAQETLVARAERLSADGQAVLQVLSVLPDGADPTVARMLFGRMPEALHEAEGSGLLTSSAERIGFHHELGRSAVASSMSFGQRLAATNNVLDALMETGAEPSLLVHISRAAGDGQRATQFALDLLEGGLAPNNHRETWKLSRIALDCVTGLSNRTIADLHLRAAEAGTKTNNHAEALSHAESAVDLLSELDVDDHEMASALLTAARMRVLNGDHHQAAPIVQRAKHLLERIAPSENLVRCHTMLAASAIVQGELERAMETIDKSVALAESNGWMEELVYALGIRAIANAGPATEQGRDDMNRAIQLGATHGSPYRHAANLYNMSVLLLRNAETAEAERLVDEAERFSREHGLDDMLFRAQVQRAHLLVSRGRTEEAETLVEEILDRAVDPGSIRANADAVLARIWARRGDERAGDLVEQAWNTAVATGEIQKIALAGITRMEYLWLQGRDDSLEQVAQHLSDLGERHRHYRLRADALRMLQRLGRQVESFERCPPPIAAALEGDHRRAADLWHEAGQPYARALELMESTDASIAFEGLRLLDRTGATRAANLMRQRLRAKGFHGVPRGPRRDSDGVVPVLTDRQLDVLRLIAQGQTNSEIADDLFVARRTVDNHVSAILGRLGVDGRREAAEEAQVRGLID